MQKDKFKYLGVIVDQHLTWDSHITAVSKKLSRSIGIMYRLRPFVDISVLKNIYHSLFFSHLVYGIEVWGSANDVYMNKLWKLQKKAMRMMALKDQYPQLPGPLNPSDPFFKELKILKIQDVYESQILKFVFK